MENVSFATQSENMRFFLRSATPRIEKPALNSIGKEAFKDCVKLKEISLPEGLEEIKENAFEGCLALTSLSVPASVTKLGANPFPSSLQELNLPVELISNVSALKQLKQTKLKFFGTKDQESMFKTGRETLQKAGLSSDYIYFNDELLVESKSSVSDLKITRAYQDPKDGVRLNLSANVLVGDEDSLQFIYRIKNTQGSKDIQIVTDVGLSGLKNYSFIVWKQSLEQSKDQQITIMAINKNGEVLAETTYQLEFKEDIPATPDDPSTPDQPVNNQETPSSDNNPVKPNQNVIKDTAHHNSDSTIYLVTLGTVLLGSIYLTQRKKGKDN